MGHDERRWCIVPVQSMDDLAAAMARPCQPLCAGFELSGLQFLNDTAPDELVEYWAVVQWYTLDGISTAFQVDGFLTFRTPLSKL